VLKLRKPFASEDIMYSNDVLLEKISGSSITETISVTELSWSLSKVINLLNRQQKSIYVKRRDKVVATIIPGKYPVK
jgi:hypothetical protein